MTVNPDQQRYDISTAEDGFVVCTNASRGIAVRLLVSECGFNIYQATRVLDWFDGIWTGPVPVGAEKLKIERSA